MKKPIDWFEELTRIPRASGDEERVCSYLEAFAKERGLAFRRDEMHNAVIKAPASPGKGGSAVMLQAHLDIVPVKDEGVEHDFAADPVTLVKEGDIWRADGTTLGADNGTGVAMIMSILDDPTAMHPPLECVFTTQEETGMYGAAALDASDLTAKTMINLDCGGEGYYTTSCAGGVRVRMRKRVAREPGKGDAYKIAVRGLAGGHSGTEIHKGRANAIKILARALNALGEDVLLLDLGGGGKDNVIASYAFAEVLCAHNPTATLRAVEAAIKAEYAHAEPDLTIDVQAIASDATPMSRTNTHGVIALMLTAPLGVRGVVPLQGNMVETSANLGNIELQNDVFQLNISIRSSKEPCKQALLEELRMIAALTGAKLETEGDYPGWAYDPASRIQPLIAKVYKEVTGEEASFNGIHAGLECGLFMGKMPGLDAVAMGMNSGGAHTTAEWMSVSSLERTYTFLKALLAELAE
jgi:dipeptidase D